MGTAGPFVTTLVGALEGAAAAGGLSVLGAALTQIGAPRDQVIRYETALKVDKYLLVLHGSADEQKKARSVLAQAGAMVLRLSTPASSGQCGRAVVGFRKRRGSLASLRGGRFLMFEGAHTHSAGKHRLRPLNAQGSSP
jgi:hypothetical protein